ncbi:UDP-glucose 4-epimerase protein [Marine Group I thaumarchaeote SCGC RSA3]|uniref:UDP-glucose 4-epimerase protein n=2 Tax=Marine Group I TaxID=905826 RepID=A0A087RM31_9ARCH|nr:UDP-glucose 4-epimerase protein [Marine Group I thaumarchaeote SCGC AAA799-D11]KFM19929.1 UDP-glucose 4-epimerase protein [Marine Group I thaumarchaeote SCGC RSA3]
MNYSSVLNNKNILITGGTGSFGHQMVEELMPYKPKTIRIFSRDEDKQHSMKVELSKEPIFKKMEFVIGDVREYDRLFAVTKDIDIIFHAAALKQVPAVESHPYEAVKTNIIGAYNIVKASVARNVKNVVAISTDKAVKPVNAMGMTKALQEKIILSDDLTKDKTKFCCVRYGNVLGSRGSVIPLWNSKIEQNNPLPVTHPDMTRFLLTLTQAIDLVFYSLKHGKGGEIFVKKAPRATMVNLAKAYAELKTGNKNYPLEYIGIRAGEKIDEVLVSHEEMRHVQEKKDHFVITREEDFDKKSIKKSIQTGEYGSGNPPHLTIEELKTIMKKLKWVL